MTGPDCAESLLNHPINQRTNFFCSTRKWNFGGLDLSCCLVSRTMARSPGARAARDRHGSVQTQNSQCNPPTRVPGRPRTPYIEPRWLPGHSKHLGAAFADVGEETQPPKGHPQALEPTIYSL